MYDGTGDFLHKLKKPLLVGLAVGISVIAALMIAADSQNVLGAFAGMDLRFLPLILLFAPLNYFFRFIKWNYYLKLSNLFPEPRINRYIFMSGLSMTITPGKLGELLKCYLLKEHMGAPVSRTSSIVMAERVTDGLSVVILSSFGLLAYPYGKIAVPISAAALLLFVLIFHFDGLFKFIMRRLGVPEGLERAMEPAGTMGSAGLEQLAEPAGLEGLKGIKGIKGQKGSDKSIKLAESGGATRPGEVTGNNFLRRSLRFLARFQRSSKILLSPSSLLFAVGIGVISWGFEGFIVFLAIKALGGEISVLASFFAVSFSSLLGALFFLPGGLGIAEGSIMVILLRAGISNEIAAAATIITRFSTLWLGVFIGIVGLVLIQRELNKT